MKQLGQFSRALNVSLVGIALSSVVISGARAAETSPAWSLQLKQLNDRQQEREPQQQQDSRSWFMEFAVRPVLTQSQHTPKFEEAIDPEQDTVHFSRRGPFPTPGDPLGLGLDPTRAQAWVEKLPKKVLEDRALFERAYAYALAPKKTRGLGYTAEKAAEYAIRMTEAGESAFCDDQWNSEHPYIAHLRNRGSDRLDRADRQLKLEPPRVQWSGPIAGFGVYGQEFHERIYHENGSYHELHVGVYQNWFPGWSPYSYGFPYRARFAYPGWGYYHPWIWRR